MDVWAHAILVLRELGMPKGVGCGGAYGFNGGASEGAGASRAVKVSAQMGIGDKVYAYLHKLRTAVRSVSESTAKIIEDWFCGEAALEVGGVDCCLGAIEEVALKNGGGWHRQGWIGKGKWVVCRAKVDSSGQCGSCREKLVTVDIDRPETETFSESVAAMAMEREVRSNFREFQVSKSFVDSFIFFVVLFRRFYFSYAWMLRNLWKRPSTLNADICFIKYFILSKIFRSFQDPQ